MPIGIIHEVVAQVGGIDSVVGGRIDRVAEGGDMADRHLGTIRANIVGLGEFGLAHIHDEESEIHG